MTLVVQKYGGTSVGTLDHIRNVAGHVDQTVKRGHRVIVTISAMGEQTDELLAMAMALHPKPPRRELDMLLTAGERISAALLSIALAERGVKALSLTGSQCGILTDETHGNARIHKILGDRVRGGLDDGHVIIVAGFQGVSPRNKEITTLGRGGSDLSAVALAASLGADACQLYKDVPGVFTADPRVVADARVLPEISWAAMTALAWSGASVLQPRSAHVASKFNIPFEIRSSLELDRPGTIVRGSAVVESPKVVAFAQKGQVSIVTLQIVGETAGSALSDALSWLWQHGESPLVAQQHESGAGVTDVTLVIKSSLADDLWRELLAKKHDARMLRRIDGLAAVTMVGDGFQQSPETLARFSARLGVKSRLIEARNTTLIACVAETDAAASVNDLHQEFLAAK